MRIGSSDEDGPAITPTSVDDTSTTESVKAQPEPTTLEMAQQLEANTKSTEKTQVIDPAAGKGAILNDMA